MRIPYTWYCFKNWRHPRWIDDQKNNSECTSFETIFPLSFTEIPLNNLLTFFDLCEKAWEINKISISISFLYCCYVCAHIIIIFSFILASSYYYNRNRWIETIDIWNDVVISVIVRSQSLLTIPRISQMDASMLEKSVEELLFATFSRVQRDGDPYREDSNEKEEIKRVCILEARQCSFVFLSNTFLFPCHSGETAE